MYIMLWALGPITLLVQHTYTCTTLYLYRTLMPHTYATYIRHWCIFSHYEIQYKSFSISNMEETFESILLILPWLIQAEFVLLYDLFNALNYFPHIFHPEFYDIASVFFLY